MSLPSGTVTFLLTDVEGSARAWQERPEETSAAIAKIEALAAETVAANGGHVVKSRGEGDSVFCVFTSASRAVAAAVELQLALRDAPLRVRVALHTGDAELRDGDYYGVTPTKCARFRAVAAGGQILCSQTTTAVASDLPPRITIRDLGAARLRSFTEPERVSQVCHPELPDDFPPIPAHTSLPAALTSFVGRHREQEELLDALDHGRLVTLTGAGGCGKSRLAIEVARDLGELSGGVWFVDLSSLADPGEVAKEAAVVLGLRAGAESPERALAARFHDEPALLILDNCEHLVAGIAALCEHLLRACPPLTIVTTSREPLGLTGETVMRVPSLAVPADGATASLDDDAVRLFVDRARAVAPGFGLRAENSAPVAEICRRLDGIPLAIELAASRVSLLSPQEIADGLDSRFALLTSGGRTALSRQRTLEASVDWSYDLLDDTERVMLRRLSVFVGTFSLDAVRSMSDAGAVIDVFGSLVAKSLVLPVDVTGLPRYRLLDTIRHYAHLKLLDAGELPAALDDHLGYFRALALEVVDTYWNDRQVWGIRTLGAEFANFRAAADHALANGDSAAALEIAQTLFWTALEPVRDERAWVRRLLDATTDGPADPRFWAYFLLLSIDWNSGNTAGFLDTWQESSALRATLVTHGAQAVSLCLDASVTVFSSLDDARAVFDRAEAIAQESVAAHISVLYYRGIIEGFFGDAAVAAGVLADCGAAAREAGLVAHACLAFGVSSQIAVVLGDLARAERDAEVAIDLASSLPAFYAHNGLPAPIHAALARGDVAAAAGLHRDAQRVVRSDSALVPIWAFLALPIAMWGGEIEQALRLGRTASQAMEPWDPFFPFSILDLVEAHIAGGDPNEADRVVVRMERNLPMRRAYGAAKVARARLALHAGDLEATTEAARAAVVALEACHGRVGVPDALRILGLALFESGDVERGVRTVAAGEAARASLGFVAPPYRLPVAHLAEEHPDAWAAGAAMTWDEAVAYAQRGGGGRKRPSTGWDSLTPTEVQVVRLVADGLTNKEIGERLFIAVPTVKTHLTHVYGKLGVSTRAQLAALSAGTPPGP